MYCITFDPAGLITSSEQKPDGAELAVNEMEISQADYFSLNRYPGTYIVTLPAKQLIQRELTPPVGVGGMDVPSFRLAMMGSPAYNRIVNDADAISSRAVSRMESSATIANNEWKVSDWAVFASLWNAVIGLLPDNKKPDSNEVQALSSLVSQYLIPLSFAPNGMLSAIPF